MTVKLEERKPKTRVGKLYLTHKEPRLIENDKQLLIVRGDNANHIVLNVLKDIHAIKRQHSKFLAKKNAIRPFENAVSLEFLSNKNDTSLFMFGSHTKKRPNNLVIGRMFDSHVLDMFEFGLDQLKLLKDYKMSKVMEGSKPALVFCGQKFESDPIFRRLKNLLIDLFKGPSVAVIAQNGLEHVLSFTICEGSDTIYFRSYKRLQNASNSSLEEIGPRMNLQMRRVSIASEELFKKALKTPKQLKPKKVKNISYDEEGTRFARIHMKTQNLGGLKPKKIKGLKDKFSSKAHDINKLTDKMEH